MVIVLIFFLFNRDLFFFSEKIHSNEDRFSPDCMSSPKPIRKSKLIMTHWSELIFKEMRNPPAAANVLQFISSCSKKSGHVKKTFVPLISASVF